MGVNSSRLPVRAIVFLGAPHRGLDIDSLQTLVKGTLTETLVMELKAGSPTLTDLNSRFAHFAKDIDILTCYETKPTKTVINVGSSFIMHEFSHSKTACRSNRNLLLWALSAASIMRLTFEIRSMANGSAMAQL